MFRNPRENSSEFIETPLKPSTGRAPTPPNGERASHTLAVTMATKSSTKPLTPRAISNSNVQSASRQSAKKALAGKSNGNSNNSILNFFKKVDSPLKDDSIFLSQASQLDNVPTRPRMLSPSSDADIDDLYDEEDITGYRFNENGGPVKRRKTSTGRTGGETGSNIDGALSNGAKGVTSDHVAAFTEKVCRQPPPEKSTQQKPKKSRRLGPFLSDSEDDDYIPSQLVIEVARNAAVEDEKRELRARVLDQSNDMNNIVTTSPIERKSLAKSKPVVPAACITEPIEQDSSKPPRRVNVRETQAKWEALQPRDRRRSTPEGVPIDAKEKEKEVPLVPNLKKEDTSFDEWGRFENVEDFPDDIDEFAEGEEFVERKWMEEQARLEAADGEIEDGQDFGDWNGADKNPTPVLDDSMVVICPICNSSLAGVTDDLATRHVNGCLDGNLVPLPGPIKSESIKTDPMLTETVKKEPTEIKFIPPEGSNRFARRAAIARPGQANPFEIAASEPNASSAFSKLMSGHAEDSAWATAAAAEYSSRGKPAYERTCPFYKIMPGFFICVDAFRYGAVQGCNAYFLSHFHSDHYVGLTSTWCHGPIYCSKVTANLVKQQLRVDPKYVVALNFEDRVEVPGTQGVAVTMIPANHCPGSSLYLFEKVIGKGSNPKIQRVLHCGDFRACPAHIAHPLLMPDIVELITGKSKQQKIDVCYLDTTYLNPRYAFPSQENVIKACADMCVSLRKERAEETDSWEVVKRERAGAGMQKFVNSAIKAEDDSIAMSIGSSKPRGRLLVICGTYSIGKERICMGIARALDCKIWAPPGKMRICAALEDPELMSRMTDDPKEAQIHMQMLMEIRAETLQDYLHSYKPHFSRVVGFRPSGWNYKPPNSR